MGSHIFNCMKRRSYFVHLRDKEGETGLVAVSKHLDILLNVV